MSRLLAAMLLVGCTSDPVALETSLDPDAGMDSCADESVVRALVFERSCTASPCHDSNAPKAGLDLESPGIEERVRNQPSIQSDCGERVLVVPGLARASFLMDKVLGTHGECGDPMPIDDDISLEEQRCLVEWIDSMQSD